MNASLLAAARVSIVACLATWIALACSPALAQQQGLPDARLYWVFPPGGQQGKSLDVSIGGPDLDDASKLVFTDPGITATQKTTDPGPAQTGPQPVDGQFTVTIKPDVKPGIYEVRAAGKYGISNPRSFVVGAQAEAIETELNNSPEQAQAATLGTVVNGRANGGADRDFYKFAASKGQRVIVDCWAYRIDSRMDASLTLLDSAGRELARSRDVNRRDPLIDFTAPADGQYVLVVHDFTYGGGDEYVYRLAIGAGPHVDFMFPPAGLPGSQGNYVVYGRNLPGSQPAPALLVEGKPLEQLTVQVALPGGPAAQELAVGDLIEPDESGVDAMAYTFPGALGSVPLFFATAPVVVEQEPNDDPAKPQKVSLPCEYVGQFYPRGDRDWISFEAKKGAEYWIDMYSQQLGLPTDPMIVLEQVTTNSKGEPTGSELQTVDDVGGRNRDVSLDVSTDDPSLKFVAPADGLYRVLVRDLYNPSRADPRHVYRLAIRPAQPDYRLIAAPRFPPTNPDPNQNPPTVWNPLLRKGGAEIIDVIAVRSGGFDGEIVVTAAGLPAGATAAPVTIGPGDRMASIVLTATDSAAEAIALLQVTGKATIAGAEVTRPARVATMIWGGQQGQVAPRTRLSRSLAIAVSGSEAAPFSIDAAGGTTLEMCRAGRLKFPVKIARRGNFKGNVQLAASGLPRNVQPKNTNFDGGKSDGEFELELRNDVPLGTYTFHLIGTSQVNYARNPEAAQAAQQRKQAVDKLAAEAAAATKSAADAKGAAEKKLNEANAASQKAAQMLKDAERVAGEMQNAANAAAEKAKAAAAAAEKTPTDQNLANARQESQKAADEAAAKAKAAAEAKAAADKAAVDAAAAAKTATDEKTASEKLFSDADAKAKQLASFQQSFNQKVNELVNRARPQNYNIGAPSTSVTIKITSTCIALTLPTPTATVKQGAKIEVPVTIARLYNFADAVPLRVNVPGGAGGLNIPQAQIAQGQTQAVLAIEAAKDAKPGVHKLTVQAIPRMNGQELPLAQELTLTVEKAEPGK